MGILERMSGLGIFGIPGRDRTHVHCAKLQLDLPRDWIAGAMRQALNSPLIRPQ
jgi:hypothetical protein